MTNKLHFYNTCVTWTRTTVLILSVFILVLSLCTYNYNAIPLLSIISIIQQQENNTPETVKQIMFDMVGDRKLIATLVAAQASIFCPLFLLLSKTTTSKICTSLHHRYCRSSKSEITRTVIEQFCQFLMPLGLALSWIFCILFEQKTENAWVYQQQHFASDMMEEGREEEDLFYKMLMANEKQETAGGWWELAAYIVNSLKYVIIGMLMVEVMIIWASSIKYATVLIDKNQQQAIGLEEEEEGEDYLVDCEDQAFEQEEKILYI